MEHDTTTEDTPDRCPHCGGKLASDGDCDGCQAAWERGVQL